MSGMCRSLQKKSLLDVLLLYRSALATKASYRQCYLCDSTSRVRYSNRYTCQYERGRQPKESGRGTAAPIPVPQVFSLLAPSFLTHTLTPLGCWLNSNNHLNIEYSVNAGTLNATCPQVSTYISGQWRFLKGQCQCSCTDTLTKILTHCRQGRCFRWCW